MNTLKRFVAALCLGLAVTSGAVADDVVELRIGVLPVPSESPEALASSFQGLADHLGKVLGVPAKVFVSPSYNALVESMGSDRLEMAFFGAEGYIAMKEQGIEVEPIAKAINTGREYYKADIIVRSDSGITSLADLKGKTFAFVAPSSTSGGLAPAFMLHEAGVKTEDLGRVLYTGTQEATMLAVKNGKVDAGAVADHYWTYWRDAGLLTLKDYKEGSDDLIESELKIIKSLPVPEMPMVVRSKLGGETIKKLKDAITALPAGTMGTSGFAGKISGFVAATHDDFSVVADMKKIAKENLPPK